MEGYRIFLSKGSSLLYRILVDRHIHTYTSPSRAYRREVVERISFESDGFLCRHRIDGEGDAGWLPVAEYPTTLYCGLSGHRKPRSCARSALHLRFQGEVLPIVWVRNPVPSQQRLQEPAMETTEICQREKNRLDRSNRLF